MEIKLTKLDDGLSEKILRAPQLGRFPNVTTVGTYDYLSQVIELRSIEKRDLDFLAKCVGQKDYKYFEVLRKLLPVLTHEQTHWVDNTSTLWGFKFLVSCYEALCHSKNESSFYKKKSIYDEIVKIKYPDYYTTKHAVDSQIPWKYGVTKGQLFGKNGTLSDSPIIFTKFFNIKDELIARQPFTLASLFEVSATAQELLMDIRLIEEYLDEDDQLIESRLLSRKFIARLYDPDLTLYSVAAHKLGNSIGIEDALEAYKMSAILAHFCFNFPDQKFSEVNLDDSYDVTDPTLAVLKLAFKNYDRAGLFYYLTDMMGLKSKKADITSKNIEAVISEMLEKMGVDLVVVEEEVGKELEGIAEHSVDHFQDDYISNLLRSGVKRFRKLGLFGSGQYPFEEFNAPGAMIEENYYFDLYGYPDKGLEARCDKIESFYRDLINFSEACI